MTGWKKKNNVDAKRVAAENKRQRSKKKLGLAIQKCKGVQEEYMALVIDAMLLEKKLKNFKLKIIWV
jgi:hypothetical protein